jgi:hypothetical protein
VVARIVAGAVLLGGVGQAAAQTTTTEPPKATTTTSTTTTTTTTLLPHPFSKATGSCIRQARGAFRTCRRGGAGATCSTQFQTDFANCFGAGAGVSCAKKCVAKEATCLTSAPATRKSCRKPCSTNRRADIRACRRIADGDNLWAGGDAACLTTAQATFDLCRFVCTEAVADCHVALKFCAANCANQ